MIGNGEAWVTLAVDDETAIKALVLAKSLKKSYTRRAIVVIVQIDGISPNNLKCLKEVFNNGVFPLEKSTGCPDCGDKLKAQLYSWNLPLLSKCVYLDPNCLVLKNSDDLFKVEEDISSNSDASVLVYRPSAKVYQELLKTVDSKGNFREIIQNHFGDTGVAPLAETYDLTISSDSKFTIAKDESDLKIVKVQLSKELSFKSFDASSSAGILEKSIWKYWTEIYQKEVLPEIKGLLEIPKTQPILDANHPEAIAIVGMSCRFPKANSIQEFWDLLTSAVDGIDFLKTSRGHLSTSEYKLPAGYLKCPVDEFDRQFFGSSPAEMSLLDPQARILLEVVWEALEDAGISPQSLYGSQAGVFTGIWTNDYKDLCNQFTDHKEEAFRKYMGNGFGTSSGRVSHFLGLCGPNIATESGCSSSMVGVDLACQNLRSGRCDLSLACGINLILHNFDNNVEGLIAPDGRCKVFDTAADGFGRAEGCSVLVLKRYSDALNNGDDILGLIRGIGISQEGTSRAIGTPTLECEAAAMKLALSQSNVQPWEVSYIEAHGTGTAVGDPLEIAAIASVYSARPGKEHREEPLTIGSVKTNIGHTESCAGIAGIIKTVLAMKNELIPQHINFKTLNPSINLEVIPARLPLDPIEWPRSSDKPRIAGVSCFGISGTDAHAILQEAPGPEALGPVPTSDLKLLRPFQLLTLSAETDKALDELLGKFGQYFETEPEDSLAEICYTANIGRNQFPHRLAVFGKTRTEIVKKITSRDFLREKTLKSKPKLCFLFTGQGCHYIEMGQVLYKTCPTFRLHFDRCDSILKKNYNLSVLSIPKNTSELSPFLQTVYILIPTFIVQCCLSKLWESWGIKPDYVLGHSLGEFAACVASGILTFEDTLMLLMERTKLCDVLEAGKMIVIRSDRKTVHDLLVTFLVDNPSDVVEFAAVNCSSQVVLSGRLESIDKFSQVCLKNRLAFQMLNTKYAYHCSLLNPILERCTEIMKRATYSKPTCNYISGMTGNLLTDGEVNPDYWAIHLTKTVEFVKACSTAFAEGCEIFLEIGPQPVLSTFILANKEVPDAQVTCLPSLRMKVDDWVVMLSSLSKLYVSGFDVDWLKFDQFYGRRKVRDLPTYPFQRKKYWFEIPQDEFSGKNFLSFGGDAEKVHPLIGNLVPSVTPSKIFNASLTLQDIPYVKDHLIGSKVLLPGSGFIEMGLTAGHLAFQGQHNLKSLDFPSNPLRLENLQIEAPLELKDREYHGLQTMVEHQGSPSESQVSIFRLVTASSMEGSNSSTKWVKHAVGKFSVPSTSESIPQNVQLAGNSIADIEELCQEHINPQEIYDKLASLGQKFGPLFRSLKTLRRSSQKNQLLATISLPEDSEKYFCHPVVIDAMIQLYGLTKFSSMDDLHVPVSIGNFTWFAKCTSSLAYIHSFFQPGSDDKPITVLYDTSGNLLATISDIQLIRTSLSAINNALDKQSMTAAVGIYEDLWRARLGPLQSRVDLLTGGNGPCIPETFFATVPHLSQVSDEDKASWTLTNRLVYLYILNAFYELGWRPKVQEVVELQKIMSSLRIQTCHEKLIKRFLEILEEEGTVQQLNVCHWSILESPGSSEILQEIDDTVKKLQGTGSTDAIATCGRQLGGLLQGHKSILEVLFSEDSEGHTAVSRIYSDSSRAKMIEAMTVRLLKPLLINLLVAIPSEKRGVLRILEVGAGTGAATKLILPVLEELKIKYRYTFTDLSSSFFSKGAKTFQAYGDNMEYKILNAEVDPLTQGFAPGQFDVVIAAFVIHATKDLRESLRHIRTLTADNGAIILAESAKPNRDIDMSFGLMEGYWRFQDLDIRPNHCLVGQDKWRTLLAAEGYGSTQAVDFYMNECCFLIARAEAQAEGKLDKLQVILDNRVPTWIAFCDKVDYTMELRGYFASAGRRLVEIRKAMSPKRVSDLEFEIRLNDKSDMELVLTTLKDMGVLIEGILYAWSIGEEESLNHEEICLPYLHLSQAVYASNVKSIPKIYVVTEGQSYIGDQARHNPGPSTLWGMSKCFRNENLILACRCIDIDPEQPNLLELFMELWNDDLEYQVSYRDRKRYVRRYSPLTSALTPLTLPNVEKYAMKLPESQSIDDLTFVAMTVNGPLKDEEIEIEVKANGLNFQNILIVINSGILNNSKVLGTDFSGIVTKIGSKVTKWKIGDAVFGCNFISEALPSHLRSPHQDLLMAMPDNMTFCEAATLPIVTSTAYHCLMDVAQLKSADTILIHTATGGVGLAAVQYAKATGAIIIATAGSHRKRAYLKTLGVQHVFHSRNTDYEAGIMKLTNGRGVDIVLNSLTSPGFKEASLKVCASRARFVEMSKLDIWTKQEVKSQRPDVKYEIVDLTQMKGDEWAQLFRKVEDTITSGIISPLPYDRFDSLSVREALTHLRKAKHVGKVVLSNSERAFVNGQYVTKQTLFNDRSTYLITGGFGGVGLEVAKWMSNLGAKNLVLVGRNQPNDKAKEVITQLRSQGKNIVSKFLDIGDLDKCQELTDFIKSPASKLPPLRGVMHAAGTLSDALMQHLTWENFDMTFRSKVNGTWNLHALTKDLNLEHFVLFSTFAAISGNNGQTTHASANSFMDSFAFYRHSIGLPALTVNWGQWGQIGVAAEMKLTGVTPFTPAQAFSALELLMKNHKTQGVVEDVDHHLLKKVFPALDKYFEEIKKSNKDGGDGANSATGIRDSNYSKFTIEYEDLKDETEKYAVVKRYVEMILRNVLKLQVDEVVDEELNFLDMGMDSLMMIELKNGLQVMTGGTIVFDVAALAERQTLKAMSEYIHELLHK